MLSYRDVSISVEEVFTIDYIIVDAGFYRLSFIHGV